MVFVRWHKFDTMVILYCLCEPCALWAAIKSGKPRDRRFPRPLRSVSAAMPPQTPTLIHTMTLRVLLGPSVRISSVPVPQHHKRRVCGSDEKPYMRLTHHGMLAQIRANLLCEPACTVNDDCPDPEICAIQGADRCAGMYLLMSR